MKLKGQGKKEWVLISTDDNGQKTIVSKKLTINQAAWFVNKYQSFDMVHINNIPTNTDMSRYQGATQ